MKKFSWFALDRDIFNDDLAPCNRPFTKFEAWIYLLSFVRGTPDKRSYKYKVYDLEVGQQLYSLRFLAEAWKWTPMKVSRFLNFLEVKKKTIKTEQQIGQQISKITICNYETWNPYGNQNETANGTLTRQQRDTNETATGQIKQVTRNKKQVNTLPMDLILKSFNAKDHSIIIKYLESFRTEKQADKPIESFMNQKKYKAIIAELKQIQTGERVYRSNQVPAENLIEGLHKMVNDYRKSNNNYLCTVLQSANFKAHSEPQEQKLSMANSPFATNSGNGGMYKEYRG